MRFVLALGGALALAGCASNERVTLLAPVQPGAATGSVVVLDGSEGSEIGTLDDPNEQARLRGRERAPRVTQLPAGAEDVYDPLMNDLPMPVVNQSFAFALGKNNLSDETLGEFAGFISEYIARYDARFASVAQADRPGLHIEIKGFADASGTSGRTEEQNAAANLDLSQRRAEEVYSQIFYRLQEAGIAVEPGDFELFAAGDAPALAASGGQRVEDPQWRKVEVTVR